MEKRREILSKIAYYCFYLAVITEVLIVLIDKSSLVNPIEGRLFQITFLLCVIKVCLTRYTWKEYLTIFLFCVLGAVSYFATGRNDMLRFVMFIAACKNIDMKKCLKLVFFMTLAGCMIIMFLAASGIYGAMSLTQEYGRGEVETRYTLGMGHPNSLQCMIWALTTLLLYLYGERMKWYHYLVVLIINIGFFQLTDSRTSLIVTAFGILMTYIVSRKKGQILKMIAGAGCILSTVFSVWISIVIAGNAYTLFAHYMFGDTTPASEFWARINETLNGRIRILVATNGFHGAISSWSAFSRPENNYFFDLGWVRLFYWYGVIPACIMVMVIILLAYYCFRKKDYMALVLITSFAVYTIIEAHAVSVYLARNYVIFIVGAYWYRMIGAESENERRIKG